MGLAGLVEPLLHSFAADDSRWVLIHGHLDVGTLLSDGVVARQLVKRANDSLVDLRFDGALTGGILVIGEDTGVSAASRVAVVVASAAVDGLLECAGFPAVDEVSVVPVAGAVAVRVDERLAGVLGLVPNVGERTGVPVDLHEDTGKANGELGVRAGASVRVLGKEGNVRLVVIGVAVLTVPAGWEVLHMNGSEKIR